jgi:hypothetical protein
MINMCKKNYILFALLLTIPILNGCTKKPVCGNAKCEYEEEYIASEYYCPQDCKEKPIQKPEENRGPERFGIEGTRIEIFNQINELGFDMREAQGVHFTKWGNIQPTAPVDGVANYLTPPKGDWSLTYFKQIKDSGIDFSASIELDNAEWALEKSKTIQVISPTNGKKMSGLIRIKPTHEQDYKNFIKHYISAMPNLKYIQIDNEPENIWVNGEGYYRALELSYQAVKEYKQETGHKVLIMAAGFNLPPYLISIPEDVKQHIYKNYPNIDQDFVKKRIIEEQANSEIKIDESLLTPQRIQHSSQKIHVTMTVLNKQNPAFDILTIHLDSGKTYNHAEKVINWYKNQMQKQGYTKPIWIDDMSNNYFPTKETEEDILLRQGLENKNPQTINEHSKRQSAWLLRKIVGHFSAGAEKVKIAYDMDIDYYMIEWRYAGLFKLTDKKPKPSYYSTKIIIDKLNHFNTATKIKSSQEDYIYKFTFANKPDIYVAWTEPKEQPTWNDNTIKTIDLTQEINAPHVEITHLINQLNSKYEPITKENKILPTDQIPLSSEPIFIKINN